MPHLENDEDYIALTVTMLVQYGDFYMHMVTAPLLMTTCEASIQIDTMIAPEYVSSGQVKMPQTIILAPEVPKFTKEGQND